MGGSFLSPDDTSPRSYDRGLVPVCVVKEREKWDVLVCVCRTCLVRFYIIPKLRRNHVFDVNDL